MRLPRSCGEAAISRNGWPEKERDAVSQWNPQAIHQMMLPDRSKPVSFGDGRVSYDSAVELVAQTAEMTPNPKTARSNLTRPVWPKE